MSDLTTVARPYAKAAFEFAVEQKAVAKWSEMLGFCAAVATHEAMEPVLNSVDSTDKVADIFIGVCGEQIDEHVTNLLKLMAENRRLAALPDVAALFELHRAELEQTADVDVRSAVALDAAQEQQIAASMEKRLGRKVKLHCQVDEGLIGGVVIQCGDIVIDGSVRGKLSRMTESLQA